MRTDAGWLWMIRVYAQHILQSSHHIAYGSEIMSKPLLYSIVVIVVAIRSTSHQVR